MIDRSSYSTALRELASRSGRMARLATENGRVMLDWVDGVPRLLRADDTALESVEVEARRIRERGIRHIIWTGMGGSVMAVRALLDSGFQPDIAIHPLDSTDPAALDAVVTAIARSEDVTLHQDHQGASLHDLLSHVLMIGVAMGMTSEEPITHLTWFADLLDAASLPAAEHLLVMTLPDSYLDRFATEREVPRLPLQPDGGTGTPGRMSAPTTRVFLLPAALYLTGHSREDGRLRAVLRRAWGAHDLAGAIGDPVSSPYVHLAAALIGAAHDGTCRVLLDLPAPWRPLLPWIEQLCEESLGKAGQGVLIFDRQDLNPSGRFYRSQGTVTLSGDRALTWPVTGSPEKRLAALVTSFLGWQIAVALFGYLHEITFVGQPAVESYKARARALRAVPDPLEAVCDQGVVSENGPLTLLAPPGTGSASPAATLSAALRDAPDLAYLDLTINGEIAEEQHDRLAALWRVIGNQSLGVPVKLRRAPAAYHASEQSEMDGPPGLISLRVVHRRQEKPLLGAYDGRFLLAQAAGTWQSMVEAGRPCYLLIVDDPRSDFTAVEELLRAIDVTETL